MCPQIYLFLDPTIDIPSNPAPPGVPSRSILYRYIDLTTIENDTYNPEILIKLMIGKDTHVAHRDQIDTATEASVTPFIDLFMTIRLTMLNSDA